MAICQLDRPMGDWLGFFGCRTYDGDWEDMSVWTHAGYPYDKSMGGVRPTFELGISVVDDDSDSYDTLEVETKADIGSGQSGGPLWAVFSGGQRQIIGTLSVREDNFGEPKNSLFAEGTGWSAWCGGDGTTMTSAWGPRLDRGSNNRACGLFMRGRKTPVEFGIAGCCREPHPELAAAWA
jgi:hypothetical protein